jgi:hypothetical protein
MPQVFTALASEVKVNQETVEGLQSLDYNVVKNRRHVGAIGTDERIAVYFGMKTVAGKLRVASINATLDDLLQSNGEFSISATLKHGEGTRRVTFDACYMEDKTFGLTAEGHAETIYSFSATRVREE